MPAMEKITADPQFLPEEITKEEFEEIWAARGADAKPGFFR
jgi:hypothetical protein